MTSDEAQGRAGAAGADEPAAGSPEAGDFVAVPLDEPVADAPQEPLPIVGPTPVGVLRLDDGTTQVVDRDVVIGRQPAEEAGAAHAITIDDPDRVISRVHARIQVQDGQAHLSDAGSANGTFVAHTGAADWTPVLPNAPVVLTPGMHVLVGRRILSFLGPEQARASAP